MVLPSRREFAAGAVTGFYTLGVTVRRARGAETHPFSAPPHMDTSLSNVNVHIFSTCECAGWATDTLEGSNISSPSPDPAKSFSELVLLLFTRGSSPKLGMPPPKHGHALLDISPNPFSEPIALLETYHLHIYVRREPAIAPRGRL